MSRKKVKGFNPASINLLFSETPEQINKGKCMEWAYLAYQRFQDIKLYSIGCHAFVKYRDRFFDSEALEGVKDYNELPTIAAKNCGCNDCLGGAKKQTPEQFKEFWGDFGFDNLPSKRVLG